MNTRIYLVDCSPLKQSEELLHTYPLLDTTRQQQVERQQTAEGKAQRAAAGVLLTHLFGKDGKPPILFRGSRGKPYLVGREDLFFNLSHSGRWVCCAVSDNEVGVDAQKLGPCRPQVASRHFTQAERQWMDEDPDERFTRLWALKEAYVKFTGFGLVLPLSSFTVPTPPDGWDDGQHCRWKEFAIEDVRIAVCAGSKEPILPPEILSIRKIIENGGVL
ncbi:MAG: 4'-phosphopantetheinyl transferase superfamily protein [Clostridia bacterium]|nr:4'-phosphopantetheinyl transferase superfamily protein [Clostridia bacterium]